MENTVENAVEHPNAVDARESRTEVPVPANDSSLNLVMLALSVGLIVLAAMTLAQYASLVIPVTVVCFTLSILGAATKQSHALLGWIATGLCAIALLIEIIAVVAS